MHPEKSDNLLLKWDDFLQKANVLYTHNLKDTYSKEIFEQLNSANTISNCKIP